jgi:opacity protein-like surface antigen
MIMRRLGGLLVAFWVCAAIVAPQLAVGQPIQGLYIGAGAGAAILPSVSIQAAPSLGLGGPRVGFSDGLIALGGAGYALGNGWRFEVEGNHWSNPFNRVTNLGGPAAISGHQTVSGVMANALFDLDIGVPWLFPYAGAGLGAAWTRWSPLDASSGPTRLTASGTSTNFAYQAIGGLSFPIPHVPGLSVTAEYRFIGIVGPETFNATAIVNDAARSGSYNPKEAFVQSVLLGLRFAFDVPPPAVQPAASENGASQ